MHDATAAPWGIPLKEKWPVPEPVPETASPVACSSNTSRNGSPASAATSSVSSVWRGLVSVVADAVWPNPSVRLALAFVSPTSRCAVKVSGVPEASPITWKSSWTTTPPAFPPSPYAETETFSEAPGMS